MINLICCEAMTCLKLKPLEVMMGVQEDGVIIEFLQDVVFIECCVYRITQEMLCLQSSTRDVAVFIE